MLVGSIRKSFQGERAAVAKTVFAQAREGLRYIREHRVIRVLITSGFGNSFAFGVITGLLVVYAVRQLGVPDDSARVGVLSTRARSVLLSSGWCSVDCSGSSTQVASRQ